MRRETWFKLLVPVLAVAATLLAGEVALRLIPAARFEAMFPNAAMWGHWTHRIDSWQERAAHYKREYRLEPGVGHVRQPPWAIHTSAAVPPDAPRVLFLGDSVTELGRFAELFRNEVARNSPQRPLLAIDAGVVGYDPVLEGRFLRHYWDELTPDLVVLQFCPNDFKRTPVIVPSPDGTWMAFNGGGLDGLLGLAFGTRSRVLQLLVGNANALLTERTRFDEDEMRAHLGGIRDFVTGRGAAIRFAAFPHFFEPLNASTAAIRRVQTDVFEPGELIEMAEHLGTLRALSDDGIHVNERGSLAVAKVFAAQLTPALDAIAAAR